MKILYCRTSYMKFYNGVTPDDIPKYGGSYVKQYGEGEEQYNFSPIKMDDNGQEVMLGFFETKTNKKTQKRNQLRIENIAGCEMYADKDSVDDVLVIWCAAMQNLGIVVTGWYRHATVYRNYQNFRHNNKNRQYNVIAKKEDCTLLPYQQRGILQWRISQANKDSKGFGEAFQWFGDDSENDRLISYIDIYDKEHSYDADLNNTTYLDEGRDNPIVKREVEKIENDSTIDATECEMLIKARVGQGVFREKLLKKYGKCLITGISTPELLIASHIKPWVASQGNNRERLSVENGLLLSPLYDKLFDKGYISFNDQMQLIVSDKLNEYDMTLINIDTKTQYIENPSDEMLEYMKYHREYVFKK